MGHPPVSFSLLNRTVGSTSLSDYALRVDGITAVGDIIDLGTDRDSMVNKFSLNFQVFTEPYDVDGFGIRPSSSDVSDTDQHRRSL